mmetsp:Transcript_6867/g.14252  ORF Transcript_6867/g.14252 Transcript_6867/m.14252 type:complete len:648 (-) Transcript_6867:38-1981(-)
MLAGSFVLALLLLLLSAESAPQASSDSSSPAGLLSGASDITVGDDYDSCSNLLLPNRNITILSTASLPWLTGTSINPLLRAASLSDFLNNNNNSTSNSRVSLMLPFIDDVESQQSLYGMNSTYEPEPDDEYQLSSSSPSNYNSSSAPFPTPHHQETYIRNWLRRRASIPAGTVSSLTLGFYTARYHPGLSSIFSMGDILPQVLALNGAAGNGTYPAKGDVIILEEPEHLSWYRYPSSPFKSTFRFALGIIHTNYRSYASQHPSSVLGSHLGLSWISSLGVQANCHKVIKLSGVLQRFTEREVVCNVNGVRDEFFSPRPALNASAARMPYYIGKLLWAKGLDRLLELEEFYKSKTGEYFPLEVYGSGMEGKEIERAFLGRGKKRGKKRKRKRKRKKRARERRQVNLNIKKKLKELKESNANMTIAEFLSLPPPPRTFHEFRRTPVPARFHGRLDHSSVPAECAVYVNPSVSEVLCTTAAEAIAMRKWAIVRSHPSNEFFAQFPNAVLYRTPLEFCAALSWCLTNPPPAVAPEDLEPLTWRSATKRLVSSARLTADDARDLEANAAADRRASAFFERVGDGATGDVIRRVLGGGVVSGQVKFERDKKMTTLGTAKIDEKEEDDDDDDNDDNDDDDDDETDTTLEEGSLL